VLTRLGARRSGWNAADVRGQVEQLIAASGIIAGKWPNHCPRWLDPGTQLALTQGEANGDR